MLVSPCKNQSNSWMIERRCNFLVVSSKTHRPLDSNDPNTNDAQADASTAYPTADEATRMKLPK